MTTHISGLLVDMNGLFRHWNDTGAHASEQLAGLPPGTIARYAYDHPSYRLARVGVLTDQEWADDVTHRLTTDFGPHLREALAPWRADRGEPDTTMTGLLTQIRRQLPVGVLSNCTDALTDDLKHHNITFDHVFSSAELGVDKPSPLAYQRAAERMGIPPDSLGYFDDEPAFVHAARSIGLQARPFTGTADFATNLRSLGVQIEDR
jgi:FMN phosphatase YigB (HAD superfamily)